MANHELENFYKTICCCSVAEDLFGVIVGNGMDAKLENLKGVFRTLVKAFPVVNTGDDEEDHQRQEVLKAINLFHEEAKQKIKDGSYGIRQSQSTAPKNAPEIKTKRYTYKVLGHIAEGDYCNVYRAEYLGANGMMSEGAIKSIINPNDNDLLETEVQVLNELNHVSLPHLVDTFKNKARQKSIVTSFIDGRDFTTILKMDEFKEGVPESIALSMLDRCLNVLGYMHHNGWIHGNLEPANLIAVGRNHNVIPIDFIFSVKYVDGKPFVGRNIFSPPEVSKGENAHPSADMFGLGMCFLYVTGGDIHRRVFSDKLNDVVKEFLGTFIEYDTDKRADDAWKALRRLIGIRSSLYPQREFIPHPF